VAKTVSKKGLDPPAAFLLTVFAKSDARIFQKRSAKQSGVPDAGFADRFRRK
jgi:hypothetical protein